MKGYECVKKFLDDQNFRYNDNDGNMTFKVEGANFIVFKNDSPFLGINQLLGQMEDLSTSQKLAFCNKMNDTLYVVKFTVHENGNVWAVYEFLPYDSMTDSDWFKIFKFLDSMTDRFFEKAKEL